MSQATDNAPKKKKRKKRMRLPNGIGSVHMIGDGKSRRNPWRARVPSHVEVDFAKGTAVQKYITIGYYPTEVDAIDALMQYRKNPYTLEAATCTFEEVFQMWKAKKYPDVSKSAQNGYDAAYKNSEPLHKLKMREIRASHMEDIMEKTEFGYQSQAKMKSLWGQLFAYALEHDIVQKNYADFVKARDSVPSTNKTAIPAEDRAKLWEAADAGNADAEIALIYIYTGMRAAELLFMEKANVDLEARIMIGGSKTEAGTNRHIPIHKSILPFVERLMQTDGPLLIMRYDSGKPQAFTYSRYRYYHWNPLMQKLELPDYTPHFGRHTCATMMREAGIEEDLRKLILGHKNADITDRYTHHPDSMLIEAIDKLPNR